MMCLIYEYDVPNSITAPKTETMRVMQQANRSMLGKEWTELASCFQTCRVRNKALLLLTETLLCSLPGA